MPTKASSCALFLGVVLPSRRPLTCAVPCCAVPQDLDELQAHVLLKRWAKEQFEEAAEGAQAAQTLTPERALQASGALFLLGRAPFVVASCSHFPVFK